ncbi:hypothetical protein SteCoe_35377 [Stentor coeruleus]|uniref:Uncharacterized protein n=1 Tax=Stentor coeruleus TaxID=5963 RepID=A0A1R2ASK1_9CILI|nr:hypothetical protein SteCoe_35377 [Stentor coeruleus]
MENLQDLKLKLYVFSMEDNNFIIKKCEGNYKKQPHKTLSLKKLSLKFALDYYYNWFNVTYVEDLFGTLNQNKNLESFSFVATYSIFNKIPSILKNNNNLKSVKLAGNLIFNSILAENLCKYLISNKIIEKLHISDTIMAYKVKFINAIKLNRSLKYLALENYKDSSNKLRFKDACELLWVVAYSLIEELLITISFEKFDDNEDESSDIEIVKDSMEKLHKTFNMFLTTTNKLWKFTIEIPKIPYKYAISFADLIIKYAKLGKIEKFSGYNLKMLLNDKTDILTLYKKHKTHNQLNKILCGILLRLLTNTKNIIKIEDLKKGKKYINIRNFINNITECKTCLLRENKKFSPLLYFCMLVFSTTVSELRYLEIEYKNIGLFIDFLPHIFSQFKSLKKIDFVFENDDSNNTKNIIEKILLNLKSVSHLSCTYASQFSIDLNAVFTSISQNTTLRKLKINVVKKTPKINSKRKLLDNNFVAKVNIVSLDLCLISISYQTIIQLAIGLRENNTITRLKLETTQIHKSSKCYSPTLELDNLLIILLSIESKKHYEKLSIFYYYFLEYFPLICNNITNDFADKYIESVNKILSSNQSLKEFNIFLFVPDYYFIKYCETLSHAIINNKGLKIVNNLILQYSQLNNDKSADIVYEKYYKDDYYLKYLNYESNFHQLASMFVSEIMINSQEPSIKNLITERIFKCKDIKNLEVLEISMKNQNNWEKIFMFNLIKNFSSLRKLHIFDAIITITQGEILHSNIRKLELLHTIKLKNNVYESKDISIFLYAKSLTYLKLTSINLKTIDLTKFSAKIKTCKLEKLTLKHFSFRNLNENDAIVFLELINAVACPTLKVLKIYYKNTPQILNVLINKFDLFTSLEYIGISILTHYPEFYDCIKKIISFMVNGNCMLKKIKVYKFTWDIEKMKEDDNFQVYECRINPVDLMILFQISENVNFFDLTEDIKDDYSFEEKLLTVNKIHGCYEAVMKSE